MSTSAASKSPSISFNASIPTINKNTRKAIMNESLYPSYIPTTLEERAMTESRKPFAIADRPKKPNGTTNFSPLITPTNRGSSNSLPVKKTDENKDYARIYADISAKAPEPSDMEGLINARTNLNPDQKKILRKRLHHNYTPNNLKKSRKNKRSTRRTRSRRTHGY